MASIPCKTNPMGKSKEPYFSLIVKPGILGRMKYGFTPRWNSGGYCKVLDWGDGTSEDAVTSGAVLTHTYSVAGTYEIKIVADCYKIIFGYEIFGNSDYSKLIYKMNGNVFKLGNLTSTANMFYDCSSLTEISETLKIPNSVTNCSNMFNGCTSLTAIPSTLTIPNSVTNCSSMFNGCTSLTAIPETFTLGNSVTNCSVMFASCNLTAIPETFKIPNSVANCTSMFHYCSDLTSDISNIWPSTWNYTGTIDLSYMFNNCWKVVGTVPADKLWYFGKTFYSYRCFYNCKSLTNYDEIPDGWKLL